MNRAGWGIKPLSRTRIPKQHIVLAALPTLAGDKTGYRESWRIASAEYFRHPGGDGRRTSIYGDATPARLWAEVGKRADPRGQTFLWTYDLTKILRITDALHCLPGDGWELGQFSLRPGAPWMSWRRGRATLKIVDAASIWPDGLDRLAELFGLSRFLPVPTEPDHRPWQGSVTQDRKILAKAVHSYLDWIAAEDLGNLAVTGNGQAWNAFRRRFLTHGILVHDDGELHAMERVAMWTGRCEAYWHGSLGVATVTEWDFSKAHTRIAAECELPVWPERPIPAGTPVERLVSRLHRAALVQAEVQVQEPIVPARKGEHIVWPVGRFTTTLWQPELEQLWRQRATVRVLGGWDYRTAPVLRAWANWVLAQVDEQAAAVPAWLAEVVRRWGNALVGRFAMRYPQWSEIGRVPYDDAFIMPSLDADTGEHGMLMQIGRILWEQNGQALPHNHAPAITGYIMSEMRVRLWRAMTMLPTGVLLYVDTDSLLVTPEGDRQMDGLARTQAGRGLRRKRSWDGMAIYGPRQIVVGEQARISGLPRAATRTGRHEWAGEVVESLEQALAGRSADAVRSEARQWRIEGTDPRRVDRGWGWTAPIRLEE